MKRAGWRPWLGAAVVVAAITSLGQCATRAPDPLVELGRVELDLAANHARSELEGLLAVGPAPYLEDALFYVAKELLSRLPS